SWRCNSQSLRNETARRWLPRTQPFRARCRLCRSDRGRTSKLRDDPCSCFEPQLRLIVSTCALSQDCERFHRLAASDCSRNRVSHYWDTYAAFDLLLES